MSTWTEAIPTGMNEARVVIKFLRENIFAKYGMPSLIIGDQSIHFSNRSFDSLLRLYSIIHRLASPYHPQTSGQVEVSNK